MVERLTDKLTKRKNGKEYLVVRDGQTLGADLWFEFFDGFGRVALLIGELERDGEGRSDAERAFQLADVEAHRLAFRHGELDLVGGEIPSVERSASRVAQTNLKVRI